MYIMTRTICNRIWEKNLSKMPVLPAMETDHKWDWPQMRLHRCNIKEYRPMAVKQSHYLWQGLKSDGMDLKIPLASPCMIGASVFVVAFPVESVHSILPLLITVWNTSPTMFFHHMSAVSLGSRPLSQALSGFIGALDVSRHASFLSFDFSDNFC